MLKTLFAPLFLENTKLYQYNFSVATAHSTIQSVFNNYGIFQGNDVRGRFTAGNTFEMHVQPSDAVPALYSKLFAVIREQNIYKPLASAGG